MVCVYKASGGKVAARNIQGAINIGARHPSTASAKKRRSGWGGERKRERWMEGSSTRESIDKRMKGEPSLVLFRCTATQKMFD